MKSLALALVTGFSVTNALLISSAVVTDCEEFWHHNGFHAMSYLLKQALKGPGSPDDCRQMAAVDRLHSVRANAP